MCVARWRSRGIIHLVLAEEGEEVGQAALKGVDGTMLPTPTQEQGHQLRDLSFGHQHWLPRRKIVRESVLYL